MAFDLPDEAKTLLPHDLISKAASSLGESEDSIQKALSGAIPAVLVMLLNKPSGSGSGAVLDLVKTVAGSGILSNLTALFNGDASSPARGGGIGATVLDWLRSIFGNKLNNIINAVSGFAGIKSLSASAVLGMAESAALAPVGKYASENNLSPAGLSSFLQSQKNSILSALPSGFNLTGPLGINSLGDIGGRAAEAISSDAKYAGDAVKNVSSGNKWLWPLLLLVAIAALIWFFTQKGCKIDTTATDSDPAITTLAGPAPAMLFHYYRSGRRLDTVSG